MQKKGNKAEFSEPWQRSDVVLVVEEKKFHVHKTMLSIWSPVFEKMFFTDFSEKNAAEIPLTGKKASEIKEMLLVIYPTTKPVTESNYAFLLCLAREYQMEQLTERCEQFLIDRKKTPTEVVDFLILADEFQMKELSKQCVEMAKTTPLRELKNHEKYAQIECERGREIAEGRVEFLEAKIKDGTEWAIQQIMKNCRPRCLVTCHDSISNQLSAIKTKASTTKEDSEVKIFVELFEQRLMPLYQ